MEDAPHRLHPWVGGEAIEEGREIRIFGPAGGNSADDLRVQLRYERRLCLHVGLGDVDLHMQRSLDAEFLSFGEIAFGGELPVDLGCARQPGVRKSIGVDEVQMRVDDFHLEFPSNSHSVGKRPGRLEISVAASISILSAASWSGAW